MPGADHRGASGTRGPGSAGPAWRYVITPGPGSRANPGAADPLHCTARRERHAAGERGWETTPGSGDARTWPRPGLSSRPLARAPAPGAPGGSSAPHNRQPGKTDSHHRAALRAGPGLGDPRGAPAPTPARRTHCCTAPPWRSASATPGSWTAARRGCSCPGPGPAPTPLASSGRKTSSRLDVPARARPASSAAAGKGCDSHHVPAAPVPPEAGAGAVRDRGAASSGDSGTSEAAAPLRPPRPPARPLSRRQRRHLGAGSAGREGRAATGRREGHGARRARQAHAQAVLARSSRPGPPPLLEPLRESCVPGAPLREPGSPSVRSSPGKMFICVTKQGAGRRSYFFFFFAALSFASISRCPCFLISAREGT